MPHLRYSCTSVKSPDSSGLFSSHHSFNRIIVMSSAASRLDSVVFRTGRPRSVYRYFLNACVEQFAPIFTSPMRNSISRRMRFISFSASIFRFCMSGRSIGMPFVFMIPRYTAVGLSISSTMRLCLGRYRSNQSLNA